MSGNGGDELNVDKTLFVVSEEPVIEAEEAFIEPALSTIDQPTEEERVPFASDWTPSKPALPMAAYAAVVFGVAAGCITLVFTLTGDSNEAAASPEQDETVVASESDVSPAAAVTRSTPASENSEAQTTRAAETTATARQSRSLNTSTALTTVPTGGLQIIRPNTPATPTLPIPSEILTTTTLTPSGRVVAPTTTNPTTTPTTQPTTTENVTTTTLETTTTTQPTTTIETTTTTTAPTTTIQPETLSLRRTDLQFRDTFLVAVYNVASEEFCFSSWTYDLRSLDGEPILSRSQTLSTSECVRWHGVPVETSKLDSGETYELDLTATSDEGKTAIIVDQVTIP